MTSADQHRVVPGIERQDMPRIIAVGVAYFLAVRLSYLFPDSTNVMAVIWPASGISLAALLLSPKRKWLLLLAVVGAVDFLGKISLGKSIPVSAGYMLANVMEPALSAWFISRWFASPVRFTRTAELIALFGAAVLMNGFTTFFGAGTAVLAFGTPFLSSYWDWYVADGMGMLLIAPLIVIGVAAGPELRRIMRWPRLAELVLFAALFCTMLWLIFGPSTGKANTGLSPYMLVLLFGWTALRFGRCITTIALLLLAVVAVGFSDESVGSVMLSGDDWAHHLMFMQFFIAVIAITALLLSVNVFERTEAEQKFRESQKLLQIVANGTTDAIYVKDLQGRYLLFNAAALRISGKSAAEVIGNDDTVLFPADEARTVMEGDRGVIASGKVMTYEEEVTIGEGGKTTFLSTKGPVIDEHGYVAGLFGITRDITDRKRAEEALRASKDLLAAVLKILPVGVWIMDANGKIIEGNPAGLQIWAGARYVGPEQFGEYKGWWLSTGKLIAPEEWAAARAIRNGEASLNEEIEIECFDGTRKIILNSAVPLRNDPGEVTGAIIVNIDITDRKRAEEKIHRHEEYLKMALSVTDMAVFNQDLDLRYTWMYQPQLGYKTEQVIGKQDAELLPPNFAQQATDLKRRVLETGVGTHGEVEGMWNDKRYIFDLVVAPLRNTTGQIIGITGASLDITELKRAEEEKRNLEQQVQQAQKMESLGVLAGGIAHDFNNILMAVLGHAELALEGISPMSPARVNLTEITTAAHRAAGLCRQMLAYAGKASFALERVGLRDLVEEMAHLLKTAISKKAILNLNLERGLPPIQADPSQIRQIVMNLIINASEAIGDRSGVITVSVGATRCDEEYLRKTELREDLAPGLYVHLEVTDTGGGMDAKTRSRIFEPFFSTKFTGRGLGLTAVLGTVRAHKGALKAYSEPGKGTTFKILFPALEDAEEGARTNDSSPLADWRGKGTILLVDDEESLIALGARMLEHLGFGVLTAADGLQAVDLYRERGKEIDLVLMDLTMPHMDGAEAFGELRRLNPDVRVVLASGYSHEDVTSRFAGKRLSGVLQKPYTLAKLRESLAGLMPKRLDGEG